MSSAVPAHTKSGFRGHRVVWIGRRVVDVVFLFFLIAAVAKLADVLAFGKSLLTWKYVPRSAIGGLVGRNAGLLALLALGAWFGRVFRSPSPSQNIPSAEETSGIRGSPAARAFTILEMIMVIAIIVLLVSLLVPALSGVRDRAKSTRTLSNLRSHATNFAAYTGDWGGVFPYITDPDDGEVGTAMVVAGREYRVTYWGATIVWPLGLLEAYYDSNMAHPSLIEAEKDVAQPWGMWAYVYSSSFIARPEFWNPETREGMHQLRPTRIQEVRYPSGKGIIVPDQDFAPADFETEFMGRPVWRVGFVDTSARIVDRADLLPGYGSGEYPFGSDSAQVGFPVTHTINGVRGLDVR